MITPAEARNHILHHTHVLPQESVLLADALGRVLAADITAPVSLPPFDNAAMDGYALKWSEPLPDTWRIVGKIPAGKPFHNPISAGECVRIFTGAPLPNDVDTVIQQEWTKQVGDRMYIAQSGLNSFANVRRAGDQIHSGELAMRAGERLSAAGIGFLASLGITQVKVYKLPRVGIIVTGEELIPPGQVLGPGQIYESNSLTLKAALQEVGFKAEKVKFVKDDLTLFVSIFQEMAATQDVILISGGISVGDHDIVRLFMEARHVQQIFYKVRQRPGKPLFFGKYQGKPIFALPGNPASVLSCFYQYVLPGLRKMGGFSQYSLQTVKRPLRTEITKKPGLTFFLKGYCNDQHVIPLDGQLSHIMRSFAQANCLIEIDEGITQVNAGEIVTVHLLPNYNLC